MNKDKIFKFFQDKDVQNSINGNDWDKFWALTLINFDENEILEIKKLLDNSKIIYHIEGLFKYPLPTNDMEFVLVKNEKDIDYNMNNILTTNDIYKFKYKLNIHSSKYLQDKLQILNLQDFNNSKLLQESDAYLEELEFTLHYNEKLRGIKLSIWGDGKEITGFYYGARYLTILERCIVVFPGIGFAYSINNIVGEVVKLSEKLRNLGVIV